MKRMLGILLCAAALSTAQTVTSGSAPQAAVARPKFLQRVIDVKYADVAALGKLLQGLQNGNTNDRVNVNPELRAISVGSYDPAFLQLVEEIVKRYDVPRPTGTTMGQHGRDIEVVAHLLLAGPQGTAGDALPADLDGVSKQLRSVFGYQDLKLLDSALIVTREYNGGEIRGNVARQGEGPKTAWSYTLRFQSTNVRFEEKRTEIDLGQLRFDMRFTYDSGNPEKPDWNNVDFNTDLSIADSQKVVVGKSKIGSGDQALILVLSARVVD